MNINFIKAEGAGNDFIIVDSENLPEGVDLSKLAKALCERKKSIGADGFLIYDKSKDCDFKMRIFNPDGQEVSMCGNGARCIALYSHKKRAQKNKFCIETKAGPVEAQINSDIPKLKMTSPKDIKLDFDLQLKNEKLTVSFIDTGVPHVVYFVDNLESMDVENVGREIRYHKEFQPEGTNANFVKIIDDRTLHLRTYERGVEEETLACGTGAVASALIASKLKKSISPIDVKVKSNDVLRVYFDIEGSFFKNVYLEGKCRLVYEGRVNYV